VRLRPERWARTDAVLRRVGGAVTECDPLPGGVELAGVVAVDEELIYQTGSGLWNLWVGGSSGDDLLGGENRAPWRPDDAVEGLPVRTLGEDPDPLWYTGALQTENGRDVGTTPLPEDVDPDELLDKPLAVPLSGQHPDASLQGSALPPSDEKTRSPHEEDGPLEADPGRQS